LIGDDITMILPHPRIRRRLLSRFGPSWSGPRLGAHLLLACIGGVALAGCDRQDAQTETSAQPVRVATVSIAHYQPIATITGQVQARIQTDLAFRVGGKVIDRSVDVGSHVKAGDVLMRIDNTEQKADVAIAEASLRAAEADLTQKKLAYRRYQALLESQAIAQQSFDQAQQELTSAQAALESARAQLATARDTLSYTELKADADGVITSRRVEVGAVVSPAQAALTIAHDGPRDAVFDIYEAFFLKGEPSTPVEVRSISDPGQKVEADIRETSPVINSKTGTIQVKLTLPESVQWPLGTPITGAFLAPQEKGAILPWNAMSWMEGKPAVWVVDPKSRMASLHPVDVALYRAHDFVVKSGLNAGDIVVTDGTKLIRPDEVLDWKG
jgi:membrane fusion protein, multidrug efflux system